MLSGLSLALCAGSAAAAECPNEELRTEKSSLLQDCRAYEQVSPVNKQASAASFFYPETFRALASETADGSVVFASHEPMPESASGTLLNQYWATRGTTGWTYRSLAPTIEVQPGLATLNTFQGNSGDLKFAVVLAQTPSLAPGAAPGEVNLYLENTETGAYRLLTTTQQVGENFERTLFALSGASSDFSRIVFYSSVPLLPEAPIEGLPGLYEYHDGQISLVGILPNGEAAHPEANGPGAKTEIGFHSVSEDGTRVYFTSGPNLFVRVNGTGTVQVSKDRRAAPEPQEEFGTGYWGASADGEVAYFTTFRNLTDDANTGKDSEGHPAPAGLNLYRFELGQNRLTDISVDADPLDAETGAQVLGVTGVSKDGASVYFVALGDLAAGAHRGEPNLYMWHEGVTRYITTLSGSDSGDWSRLIPTITSRISPDGKHLLFVSAARLTDYDNTDAVTGQPDTELYLYSADSEALKCVSCNPDGSLPRNSTTLATFLYNETAAAPNYMSADGSIVAFVTSEALVPRDTNGLPDIYEYHDGQVALISTGAGEFPAEYADMSPDGRDIYFSTAERLVKGDIDNFGDLYDARVGGGFVTAAASAECNGFECVRQVAGPPSPLPLSSQAFNGPGDVHPVKKKRCGQGRRAVKSGGKVRCVKKRPSKAKRRQKGHRGAGSKKGGSK